MIVHLSPVEQYTEPQVEILSPKKVNLIKIVGILGITNKEKRDGPPTKCTATVPKSGAVRHESKDKADAGWRTLEEYGGIPLRNAILFDFLLINVPPRGRCAKVFVDPDRQIPIRKSNLYVLIQSPINSRSPPPPSSWDFLEINQGRNRTEGSQKVPLLSPKDKRKEPKTSRGIENSANSCWLARLLTTCTYRRTTPSNKQTCRRQNSPKHSFPEPPPPPLAIAIDNRLL